MQEKLRVSPIAFKLLDKAFKMDEVQRIYELIHERKYDRRNFMRKMEASGFLRKIEEDETSNSKSVSEKKDSASSRTLYVYSFDEIAFQEAQTSKEWRKYPFDF